MLTNGSTYTGLLKYRLIQPKKPLKHFIEAKNEGEKLQLPSMLNQAEVIQSLISVRILVIFKIMNYRTHAIITRAWFLTALEYKSYVRTEFYEKKAIEKRFWPSKSGFENLSIWLSMISFLDDSELFKKGNRTTIWPPDLKT